MNTKSPPARLLCANLEFEILSWLPPKSLIRYRSVSKSWYSTIHDPSFIIKHTQNQSRNDDNRTILVIPKSASPICRFYSGKTCEIESTFNLPFKPFEFEFPKVDSSCNGLLCISDYCMADLRLHLWNPSIRILKQLPPPPSFRNITNSYTTFGIGFHSPSNDYRVVRLTHYYENWVRRPNDITRTEVEVYSLSTGCWRMVELDGRVRETRKVSVSVNGYIYWLATERRILSFNTNNDSFEEILHPCGSGLHLKIYHISVVRGRLCLLIAPYFGSMISSDGGDREHEIWMMREHGVYESWTKVRTFRQGERFSGTFGMTVKGELLQFTGIDHENMCVYDHENLRYYDLWKGEVVLDVSYMKSLVLLDTEQQEEVQ